MIHRRVGRKLKRTASHRKAMLCNMASSLFQHKKISTTEAKAKELRPFAEALITRAKHAILREQQGQLPTGQVIDIHNRREVYKSIRDKGVVQELFDTIAPAVASRPGGYTRIVKLGTRRGDAGRIAIIELVDFAASRDGIIRNRRKKTTKQQPTLSKPTSTTIAKTEEEIIVAPTIIEEIEAPIVETTTEMVNAPAEEIISEEVAPVEEVIAEVVTPTEVAEMTSEVANETEVEIADEVAEMTSEVANETEVEIADEVIPEGDNAEETPEEPKTEV